MPNDGIQSIANRFCISATPAVNRTWLQPKIIARLMMNTTAVAASEIHLAWSPRSGATAMNSATTAGRNTKTLKNAVGVDRSNMGSVQDSGFREAAGEQHLTGTNDTRL